MIWICVLSKIYSSKLPLLDVLDSLPSKCMKVLLQQHTEHIANRDLKIYFDKMMYFEEAELLIHIKQILPIQWKQDNA